MNIKFENEMNELLNCRLVETFKASLSNSAPNEVQSMDLVKSSEMNEEMRRKSRCSSFIIQRKGRSKSKGLTRKNISKSKNDQFANVECHYNGLIGHINKHRQKFKRDNKIDKSKENKNDDNSDADTVVHFIRR